MKTLPDTATGDPALSPADADAATSPSTVDPRPTMADVLEHQEHLRRDHAEADAARRYTAAEDAWRRCLASPTKTLHSKSCTARLKLDRSQLPGGNLRVKVKSKEACLALERTKVNILGGVFLFKGFDVLGGKYFIDISNVDSDTNTDVMLHRLFLLGCKPVYDTFREVNLATGITSATWRVYFLSTTCPSALIVNGSVCDQVLFDNKLHPAHGKNAPFQSEHLPFGYRSHHGIDLATTDDEFSRSTCPSQHGQRSAATQLANPPSNRDDALSISTFGGSNSLISPPGSPKHKSLPLLLTSDGFTTVTKNKKKRGRSGIDFSALLVKQQPLPLDGIATENYFDALQSTEVKFKAKNVTADTKYGVRCQIVPVDVKSPAAVKDAKEFAFFVGKHHTKIKKASRASPISEVTESMLNDENSAQLDILSDRLAEADTKVDVTCKLVENATNPDHITNTPSTVRCR
ncbi:unnamed protein product [Peronospora destructor]|uniref:Uncharacterized protein n=1 Tax=Peronospora destructor TaxID=86335 RepID=A0AAV0TM18_9STRA|nr:unnamed protein product [Peronospora destructor]